MVILLIIFMGMIGYKNFNNQTNQVNIKEIEKIESYMNQIYMWRELTGQALPCFEDINQADETWIWEVVKKNLEDVELSYEQIQNKAKELFGDKFTKEFPKEGTEFITYDDKNQIYHSEGIELAEQSDLFLLNAIKRTKKGYEIEIIEYLEDSSPMLKEEPEDYIVIKNLRNQEIGRIRGLVEDEEVALVKNNKDKFSQKKIQLREEKEQLYVERVYE